MWVINQKGHRYQAAHTMCLDEARYIAPYLFQHRNYLIMLFTNTVVPIPIPGRHPLSFQVNNMGLKAVESMMNTNFKKHIAVFRVAVDHHDRCLGLTTSTYLAIFIFAIWSNMSIQCKRTFQMRLGRHIFPDQFYSPT